jgi:hypothetical protein
MGQAYLKSVISNFKSEVGFEILASDLKSEI